MDIRKIDRSSMEKLNERQICVTGRTFCKILTGPDNNLQEPDIRRMDRSSVKPDYSDIFVDTNQYMQELNIRKINRSGRTFCRMLTGPNSNLQELDIRRMDKSSVKPDYSDILVDTIRNKKPEYKETFIRHLKAMQ